MVAQFANCMTHLYDSTSVELVDCKKLHKAGPMGALARIGKALYLARYYR